MSYLRLPPHISAAFVDDRPVFLDVRRDRYFALESDAEALVATLGGSGSIELDTGQVDLLLETGLYELSDEPCPQPFVEVCEPRTRVPASAAPARFMDVLRISLLLARARCAVRFGRLERVLERRSSETTGRQGPVLHERAFELVQRFHRARQLVPIRPVCLQDSLALHDWLARHGKRSLLVLGVKLDPFEAHCWLQVQDVVLNDEPDRVSAFTPIRVVA